MGTGVWLERMKFFDRIELGHSAPRSLGVSKPDGRMSAGSDATA
jgi:hypothetical protein